MTKTSLAGRYTPDEPYEDVRSVYFVQAANGLIKIGVSVNPQDRIRSLQTMSPVALTLFGVLPGAGAQGEAELHKRFAADRDHGEWFRPSVDLLTYIAGTANELPAPEESAPEGRAVVVLRPERLRAEALRRNWHTKRDLAHGLGISEASISRLLCEDPARRQLPGAQCVISVLVTFPDLTFEDFFEVVSVPAMRVAS